MCRHSHLNTLVRVHGVVTRRTGVFPQLALLYYSCGQCGASIGPLTQSGDAAHEIKPLQCPECQGKGPFIMDQQQTVYRNYQKITLQVRATACNSKVPAGLRCHFYSCVARSRCCTRLPVFASLFVDQNRSIRRDCVR